MARTITREAVVQIASRPLRYTLVRMARRRHVHLVVADDGRLQVRAPWRFSLAEAESLIRSHEGWVWRRVQHARERAAQRPALVNGASLPFAGRLLRLELVPGRAGRAVREGDRLRVAGIAADDREALREAVQKWYLREARRLLPERLHALGRSHGLSPARVVVRAQRTRWGSCSARGTISLNWRLVQLAPALADYVLVHELCHLRHLNHSADFWALVGHLMPDWRVRREQLRGVGELGPV